MPCQQKTAAFAVFSAAFRLSPHGSVAYLRLQVILLTDHAHQVQLRFQEVDVLFGVFQDVTQQVAADWAPRSLRPTCLPTPIPYSAPRLTPRHSVKN